MKKTFAARAEGIKKKYPYHKRSKIEHESMMEELQLLANEQEAMKARIAPPEAQQQMAMGGNTYALGGNTNDVYLNLYALGGASSSANVDVEEYSPNPEVMTAGQKRSADWMEVYNLAKEAGDKFPEITASQWALESAWGTKMTGDNNPFGQTTKGEGKTIATPRDPDGGSKKFKNYDSLKEAITDHVKRWNPKYKDAKTVEEAVKNIQNNGGKGRYAQGFATDEFPEGDWMQYVNTITKIADQQVTKNEITSSGGATQGPQEVAAQDPASIYESLQDNGEIAAPAVDGTAISTNETTPQTVQPVTEANETPGMFDSYDATFDPMAGPQDNPYGGLPNPTLDDVKDELKYPYSLQTEELYDKNITALAKRLTKAYESLSKVDSPTLDQHVGGRVGYPGQTIMEGAENAPIIRENIKKLEGELNALKGQREQVRANRKPLDISFPTEGVVGEDPYAGQGQEVNLDPQDTTYTKYPDEPFTKTTPSASDMYLDGYKPGAEAANKLALEEAQALQIIDNKTKDPGATTTAARDSKFLNALPTALAGLGAVAPIMANIKNRKSIGDAQLIQPEIYKPSIKSRWYDSQPIESMLSNQLASSRTSLSDRGGNAGDYISGLRAINMDNAMSMASANVEGQKLNMNENTRIDSLLSDANKYNAGMLSQAKIDKVQRQDFKDTQKRDYLSAIGSNISGAFETASNAALASKLSGDMETLAMANALLASNKQKN